MGKSKLANYKLIYQEVSSQEIISKLISDQTAPYRENGTWDEIMRRQFLLLK